MRGGSVDIGKCLGEQRFTSQIIGDVMAEANLPIHEKHEALVAAGWKPVTEYQGILTKYLPPDGGETKYLAGAWLMHMQNVQNVQSKLGT